MVALIFERDRAKEDGMVAHCWRSLQAKNREEMQIPLPSYLTWWWGLSPKLGWKSARGITRYSLRRGLDDFLHELTNTAVLLQGAANNTVSCINWWRMVGGAATSAACWI